MGEGTLTPAAARRHIIKRPRLTRLLDETSARIILLVAPAGYGKTTLAREWLEGRQHVWHRATAASGDPAALCLDLARCLGSRVPRLEAAIRRHMSTAGTKSTGAAELAALLVDEISDLDGDTWLAIDDYQALASSPDSEAIIDRIASSGRISLLVTSRHRPAWATARRMMYGEISELGMASLALTQDEARAILGTRSPPEVAGLLALARGWPAVIGLAAHSSSAPADRDVPEKLYDFFADELYLGSSHGLKNVLPLLVLLPRITPGAFRSAAGSKGSMLAEAVATGILVASGHDVYEIHPLLGAFLQDRLSEEDSEGLDATADRLVEQFLSDHRWDDAAHVIERLPSIERYEALLSGTSNELLAQGRHETVKRWLANARGLGDSPVFHLVAAELAFRDGEYERAKLSALIAAERLPRGHPLSAQAWLRAAYAADFGDSHSDSFRYFQRARKTALTHHDLSEALRGLVNVAILSNHPEARRIWQEYADSPSRSHEEALRKATGRMVAAAHFGEVEQGLADVAGARALLKEVDDPMIRTSFLNNYAYTCLLSARYSEALESLRRQLAEHNRYGLSFAVPHALVGVARAEIGLGRYSSARRSAARALACIDDQPDPHVALNLFIVSTRLKLEAGEALDFHESPLETFSDTTSLGEAYAVRGLLQACQGDADSALADAEAAQKFTAAGETRALRSWIRPIVSLRRGHGTIAEELESALDLMVETGIHDSFIAACRGFSELISLIIELLPDRLPRIGQILSLAGDWRIARRFGLPMRGPRGSLSPRECEVLALLSRGSSNSEIASQLVITEATVKVHVRHIFEKLGVKSRTAAAHHYLDS